MGMTIDEWELVFDENSAASELERFLEILQKQETKDDIGKAINRKNQSVIKVAIQACKFRADYETRLKADMVTMLEDLRLDFQEAELAGVLDNKELIFADEVDDLVQQKINALKGDSDGA